MKNGYSVLELLVVLAIVGIMSLVIGNNLVKLSNPLQNSSNHLLGFFKQARAKAISTTSAYIVDATSTSHIRTRSDVTCNSGTAVNDPQLALDLDDGVTLGSTNWRICFTPRGLPDTTVQLVLSDATNSKTVEVFLGGAVRIQ